MNRRILGLALLALAVPAAVEVRACSIPVFRYALERWDLGTFEVFVFHSGPLTAEEKAMLAGAETPHRANLTVTMVDLASDVEPGHRKLWQQQATDRLPWVVLRSPDTTVNPGNRWTGPLAMAPLEKMIDSPARKQMVRHLSEGAIVFVLLESGDAKADDAAAGLLGRELASLKERVRLAEPTAEGPQLLYPIPLRASFPVLRLSTKDVAEEQFVRMLLESEPDLSLNRGPLVFPIFGRGRLLCSLQAKQFNADNITAVVRFLTGDCSCELKGDNPGVDLLIAADWPSILKSTNVMASLAEHMTLPATRAVDVLDAGESLLVSTSRNLPAFEKDLSRTLDKIALPSASNEPTETCPTAHCGQSQGPTCSASSGCGSQQSGQCYWLWSGAGGALLLVILTGLKVIRGGA